MRVGLLGFGLIGGSLAQALAAAEGPWEVAAWSPSGDGPRRAAADGTIAAAAPTIAAAIDAAELVVLAAPPLACLELLDELGGPLRAALVPDALVTDVASTKRRIAERAAAHGLRFVGGHPMAGRETTGYGAATADLFRDRPWVVCPPPGASEDDAVVAADVERVEGLARAAGARSVRMAPAEHDAAVAAVSHLPLVVSAALVEAVAVAGAADWPAQRALAASGWRDMSRLARGDVEMGAGIGATNADEIAVGLRRVRDVIDGWLAALEAPEPDADELRRRLAAARAALDAGTEVS